MCVRYLCVCRGPKYFKVVQALFVIRDLLEHEDKLADRTLLSPRQILDLLDILPHNTYFKFNGDFYQQTDGAAMGGPTSAIVSEICMQSLETTAITTADHPPKVWERHVDDVFSIVNKNPPTRTTRTHQQFTSPNTVLQRRRKQLQSSISRHLSPTKLRQNHLGKNLQKTNAYKPVLEIHITQSNICKQSVITALFDRADNVVSNEKDKIEEKHHISAALQQNGYLKEFIQRTVKKHNMRKEQPRVRPEEEEH